MRTKFYSVAIAMVLAVFNPLVEFNTVHAEDAPIVKAPVILDVPASPSTAASAPIPIKISVEAAPALSAPAQSVWERLFTSSAAVTVYITVGIYALKWASDRYKLDLERWEGIIMHCYNDAESSGVLNSWSGHEKLAHAMQLFDDRFRSAFGTDPTARDREDARLDFARTAFNDTSGGTAPTPTSVQTSV